MQDRKYLDDDGLVAPPVGRWAERKYHFLERYLTIVSSGMKNRWKHLQYIDLFTGAGLAKIKGTSNYVKTSALIAAGMDDPFTYLHLCEKDAENCQALQARLETHAPGAKVRVYQGDANECIDEILQGVPKQKCLAVVFVDPFGLHFDFETAKKIATRRADLIILLADTMDAMRNWRKYYLPNPNSTLDKMMGESGWREEFENTSNEKFPEKFRNRYIEQLSTLSYKHFESKRVRNASNRDIYILLYATADKRGIDFWNKAQSVDETGQREMLFE